MIHVTQSSRAIVADKIADARARGSLIRRAKKAGDTFLALLAQLPCAVALPIAGSHRARLAELGMVSLDPDLLARTGAGWVAAVQDLAAIDPEASEALTRRMADYVRGAP